MTQTLFYICPGRIKLFLISLNVSMILFLSGQVFALEYGIFANAENSAPIDKFFVIGERCSGTNFIHSLILQNFEIRHASIGQKHFPPWYELPQEYYTGNSKYYDFANTEDYLFVVIFRNAYDWVRSFHREPWEADKSLRHIPFSKFIRTPWEYSMNNVMKAQYRFNPFVDHNPIDGSLFENVFALRNAKIRTMLQIRDRAPNVYYINYEIARDHPQKVLREIEHLYNVVRKPEYEPVTTYKGKIDKNKTFAPKKYHAISQDDLSYINSQLDEELENLIGYKLMLNADNLDNSSKRN